MSRTPGRDVSTICKLRLKFGALTVPRAGRNDSAKEDYNPCFLRMVRCSVIVVTHNSATAAEACLRALACQDCEIIVVDNASQDGTLALLRRLESELPLRLLAISRNLGFAGGVNHGAAAASGQVLLLLNPDAVAEPAAIDALLACLKSSGADAAGGALLDANGQPDQGFCFRRLPTPASLAFEALLINQAWPRNPVNRRYRCLDADYSQPQIVDQPAGACLAVLRTAWDALHGMDEGFFPVWFEDVDFCARLLGRHATIVYCPQARFRHSGAHSVGRMAFRDKQRFWYGNMLRYAQSHFSAISVLCLRAAILGGMGLRILACLVGAKPAGVPFAEALRGYAGVAALTLGSYRRSPG